MPTRSTGETQITRLVTHMPQLNGMIPSFNGQTDIVIHYPLGMELSAFRNPNSISCASSTHSQKNPTFLDSGGSLTELHRQILGRRTRPLESENTGLYHVGTLISYPPRSAAFLSRLSSDTGGCKQRNEKLRLPPALGLMAAGENLQLIRDIEEYSFIDIMVEPFLSQTPNEDNLLPQGFQLLQILKLQTKISEIRNGLKTTRTIEMKWRNGR